MPFNPHSGNEVRVSHLDTSAMNEPHDLDLNASSLQIQSTFLKKFVWRCLTVSINEGEIMAIWVRNNDVAFGAIAQHQISLSSPIPPMCRNIGANDAV